MLLSTVVNLLSSVNSTQSAQQATSPLILSWSDPALMIPVVTFSGSSSFRCCCGSGAAVLIRTIGAVAFPITT